MYLKQSPDKRTGRIYLSIVKGYRDENNKPKAKTVKSLGYMDDLKKEYDDPISYFTQLAKEMTEEQNSENKLYTIQYSRNEVLEKKTFNRKNFGYVALVKIYHELSLDRFFMNEQRRNHIDCNTNSIMLFFTISRLLNHYSDSGFLDAKNRYFERFNFDIQHVQKCLSHLADFSSECQHYIHNQIIKKYKRNSEFICYIVTNYCFGIDKIVQSGLFMDANGLPIAHKIFTENVPESMMIKSIVSEIKEEYGMDRVVFVSDVGMCNSNNVYNTRTSNDNSGYILNLNIRGMDKKFKDYVLYESGYFNKNGKPAKLSDDFKIKSRIYARKIQITDKNGEPTSINVEEKQIVFYSRKHDRASKAARAAAVAKAYNIIENPGNYNVVTCIGSIKYIHNIDFDKKTGKVIIIGNKLTFNTEMLKEEEQLDGYFAVVTSELNKPNHEIMQIFMDLPEIENSFNMTKYDFETKSFYLSENDQTNSHFLTCFISYVIARLLRLKLNNQYSVEELMNCLNKISCAGDHENMYLFDYRDDVSDAIGAALNIDFTKKRLPLSEIKKILGEVKKRMDQSNTI